MSKLKIERHNWQPAFKNEIWIMDTNTDREFTITLKEESDIEIDIVWDYGYACRGSERMSIPVDTLLNLLNNLKNNK